MGRLTMGLTPEEFLKILDQKLLACQDSIFIHSFFTSKYLCGFKEKGKSRFVCPYLFFSL